MNEEYYIIWKGQSSGPFGQVEIKRRLLSGEITPLHLVTLNGNSIDHVTWTAQIREAMAQEQQERQREVEALDAHRAQQLQYQHAENQRLQRELAAAKRPPAPPPPQAPTLQPPTHTPPPPPPSASAAVAKSSKQRIVYVLLALFLGFFGIHNFYAGYTGRAITQLLLFLFLFWTGFIVIGLFIWVVIEMITVTHDSEGARLQ